MLMKSLKKRVSHINPYEEPSYNIYIFNNLKLSRTTTSSVLKLLAYVQFVRKQTFIEKR